MSVKVGNFYSNYRGAWPDEYELDNDCIYGCDLIYGKNRPLNVELYLTRYRKTFTVCIEFVSFSDPINGTGHRPLFIGNKRSAENLYTQISKFYKER